MSGASVQAWEIAAESLGLPTSPRVRPNPALWIWYAFWGPLPERYSTWVLYDGTCSTWVLRYLARVLAAAAVPVTLIAVLLPAPGEVRAWTAFAAGACAVMFTVVWINESTESRLARAGWGWDVGPALRSKRDEIVQRLREW